MTPCERLTDRIPDVVRGRSRWSEVEAAHLAQCAECRAEEGLVRAAAAVGAAALPRDPDATADAVLRRLARKERERPRRGRRWLAGAAAAAGIALAAWLGRAGGPAAPAGEATGPIVEIALPELEPLETAELDSLLETMDAAPTGWSATDETTLNDLNTDELEQVLQTWEG